MKHSRTRYRSCFVIALYQDDGNWVAHNLSLDIVASNKDKNVAIAELRRLSMSQIKFCIENGHPEILNRPAPERFWKQVAEKQTAKVMAEMLQSQIDVNDLVNNAHVIELDPLLKRAQARQTA